MTQDFRSAKEYIYRAEVGIAKTGAAMEVVSDGQSHAVRLEKAEPYQRRTVEETHEAVVHQGEWHSMKDGRDSGGGERYSNQPGAAISYRFMGRNITWLSVKNHNCGLADVYLDGQRVATVDLYASSKTYQQPLFERDNLGGQRAYYPG